MKSLVSIIIPTYNRANLIGETLDSVLAQTYTNWECIIVDDGSTDNTQEVAKKWVDKDSRFNYWYKENAGVSSARNLGFEKSYGDFIVFLDSDDILANFSLSKRVQMFSQYPDNDGLVFSTYFFKDNIKNLESLFNIDPEIKNKENYLALFLNYQFPFTVMSPIWRRAVLQKIKFKDGLQLLEDVVFHIEILFLKNIKIQRINLVDNYYRRPSLIKLSSPTRPQEMIKSLLFIINKYNEKIISNAIYKNNFSRFLKIIYRISILNQVKSKYKLEVYKIALKYEYITLKEQSLFLILSFICKIKVDKKRKIGMYRFIKYLNKKLIP
jgi:glycosyltransferase involved in cell wall biosynthesis